MNSWLLVLSLALALGTLYAWAFTYLPRDGFQVLAAVPWRRRSGGSWRAGNLTWYGLFSATAATVAAALFLLLASSFGVSPRTASLLAVMLLVLGSLASRAIARWVEGKPYGFTVGGAGFAVLLVAGPALGLAARLSGEALPEQAVLAALATSYVFGESIGRLACISFGCCYGKPLESLSPGLRRWLRLPPFRFQGATRKIAFASGLEGVAVVPIQAITASVLALVGLLSLALLLAGWPRLATLVAISLSQLWRVVSERLRADHRGGGRLSTYQWLALLAIPLGGLLTALLPAPANLRPELGLGFAALWSPGVVLLLEGLWVAAFLRSGWSRVTGATVSFQVYRSRI